MYVCTQLLNVKRGPKLQNFALNKHLNTYLLNMFNYFIATSDLEFVICEPVVFSGVVWSLNTMFESDGF